MPNCIASQCLDGNSTSQQQTLSIGSRIVVPENRNVWLAEHCKEDVGNQMGFWFVIFPAARGGARSVEISQRDILHADVSGPTSYKNRPVVPQRAPSKMSIVN